jgi:hypothetical protein
MDPKCIADKMSAKVKDLAMDLTDARRLRSIEQFEDVHYEKRYNSYLEAKPAADGKPAFPALLEGIKDENGKIVAAIPSLQVIEMLSRVDFSQIGVSLNFHNLYQEKFGTYCSDSLGIYLNSIYSAGKGLAHTGDVPPTPEQIYEAIKNASTHYTSREP